MKVEINIGGSIVIIAETIVEAFALNHIIPVGDLCPVCGQYKMPITINCSILNEKPQE